jgi:malate dehydrogenase
LNLLLTDSTTRETLGRRRYGIKNCYLGVPVILGKNGVEKVIELDLNAEEKALPETSRSHVQEVMTVLDKLPK